MGREVSTKSVEKKRKTTDIADKNEIRRFWTNLMRCEEADVKERIKTSEYLAKTCGMFDYIKSDEENETIKPLSLAEKLALIEEIKKL